jgi:hypothetical protein
LLVPRDGRGQRAGDYTSSNDDDEEEEEEVDFVGMPFVVDDDDDFGELILDCSSTTSPGGRRASMSGMFGRRRLSPESRKVDVDARAEDYDASVADDV